VVGGLPNGNGHIGMKRGGYADGLVPAGGVLLFMALKTDRYSAGMIQ
jgi:hypothetical protein